MISDKTAKISIKLFVTTILVLIAIFGINAIMVNADIPDVWYCTNTAYDGGVYKVCTEIDDYTPESTVFMKGSGFNPDASLTVKVTRPDGSVVTGDGPCFQDPPTCEPGQTAYDNVTVDATGHFNYDYKLDGILGKYLVEVIDVEGNVIAAHTFTDAHGTTTTLNSISTPLNSGQTNVAFSGTVTSDITVPSGLKAQLRYILGTTCPSSGEKKNSGTIVQNVSTVAGGGFSGTFTAPSTS